jgi:hypothetical protein
LSTEYLNTTAEMNFCSEYKQGSITDCAVLSFRQHSYEKKHGDIDTLRPRAWLQIKTWDMAVHPYNTSTKDMGGGVFNSAYKD